MLHPSVSEEYRDGVIAIQIRLSEMQCGYAVTQSIIEIWRLVYSRFPNLIWAQVPEYPHFWREYVTNLTLTSFPEKWDLIDDRDYEYFRVLEYFVSTQDNQKKIAIDLSFYNVYDGIYWKQLDPAKVIKYI